MNNNHGMDMFFFAVYMTMFGFEKNSKMIWNKIPA
jgi:pyruvate dehydrogenase complex dehydrogenase (E1) component